MIILIKYIIGLTNSLENIFMILFESSCESFSKIFNRIYMF